MISLKKRRELRKTEKVIAQQTSASTPPQQPKTPTTVIQDSIELQKLETLRKELVYKRLNSLTKVKLEKFLTEYDKLEVTMLSE